MTQFTPETQAIILLLAAVGELESKVLSLEDENKELADKLKMNSRNSSKPPSTDGYNKPSYPKTQMLTVRMRKILSVIEKITNPIPKA